MIRAMVSVIVPTYNYGRYVTQAVDSSLAQTYRNLEVIVVDDGSTDDTRDRLAPYGDRIRYIHQKNLGLSAARNTGIRAARGEWIALLDADDVWHPEKTEVQLGASGVRDRFGLIGSLGTSDARVLSKPLTSMVEVRNLGLRDFFLSMPFGPSSVLIRRSCLDEVEMFDESLKGAEDRDMWLRLVTRFPVARVESLCWFYRLHPDQLSRNVKRTHTYYSILLKKFFESHPALKSYRPIAKGYLDYDAALAYLLQGESGLAMRHLATSLVGCPWGFDRNDSRYQWCRTKLLVRLIVGAHLTQVMSRILSPRPGMSAPVDEK